MLIVLPISRQVVVTHPWIMAKTHIQLSEVNIEPLMR